jgi:hypothetical protein
MRPQHPANMPLLLLRRLLRVRQPMHVQPVFLPAHVWVPTRVGNLRALLWVLR